STSASSVFVFYCCGAPRYLLSFPTRRSSDLACVGTSSPGFMRHGFCCMVSGHTLCSGSVSHHHCAAERHKRPAIPAASIHGGGRSEEHTSELQSLAYLVCRLLLEKKKKRHTLPFSQFTIPPYPPAQPPLFS